jgi:hypothetical protein
MAQFLGHILEHVQAVATEARCCLSIGDFKVAAQLCERGRGLLLDCGMQGTYLDLGLQNYAAEIHHVKTEFPEARTLYAQLANSGKTYFAAAGKWQIKTGSHWFFSISLRSTRRWG